MWYVLALEIGARLSHLNESLMFLMLSVFFGFCVEEWSYSTLFIFYSSYFLSPFFGYLKCPLIARDQLTIAIVAPCRKNMRAHSFLLLRAFSSGGRGSQRELGAESGQLKCSRSCSHHPETSGLGMCRRSHLNYQRLFERLRQRPAVHCPALHH